MAKPRPPEETDAFMVRPPESIGSLIRDLASRSLDEKGGSMSPNRYIVEILKQAVQCGTTVRLEVRSNFLYDSEAPPPALRLNDADDNRCEVDENPDPTPDPNSRR